MENKERIQEIKEEIKRIDDMEEWDNEEYDEYLDEIYSENPEGLVDVYGGARILKEVDEIAYNMGAREFWDNKRYELEEELKELEKSQETETG